MHLICGISVVAGLLWAVPACAQLILPSALRQPPPAKCDWSKQELGSTATLVAKREVSVDSGRTVHIWMVRAGNRIALSPAGVEQGEQVSVQIFAKMAETSDTFSKVCREFRVDGSQPGATLRANAPIGSDDVLWRVEVRFDEVVTGKIHGPLSLTTWDVSSASDESAWKRGIPLHGMLCLEDIPEMERTKPVSHQFGGRIRLEVNAEQTTYPLTAAQRRALSSSVLNSVALWVRSCIACRVEHLVIVAIEDQVYTRASANAWLEKVARRPGEAPNAEEVKALEHVLQPVVILQAGARLQSPLMGKELERYELMPEEHREFLCRLRTSQKNQRILNALRRAACGATLPRGEGSKIRVRFRNGLTACGDDKNVIACRSDLELTEYNARDYRFTVDEVGSVDIGSGAIDVDLQHVVAHEMGHWIGLSHIDKGQSLMSSSMEDSRCIDKRTVDSLLVQNNKPLKVQFPQAFTMLRKRQAGSIANTR